MYIPLPQGADGADQRSFSGRTIMSAAQAQASSSQSRPSTRSESNPVVTETTESCMDITPEVQGSVRRPETRELCERIPEFMTQSKETAHPEKLASKPRRRNTVEGSTRGHDGGKQKKVDVPTPEQDGLISAVQENETS